MKKIISVMILIILFASVLLTSISTNATNVNLSNYDTQFVSESGNVYLMGTNDNKFYVKKYTTNNSSEYTYELDYDIINYCITDGKIYVLCKSNIQINRYFFYLINNGKLSLYFSFSSAEIKSNSKFIADNDGYIYVNIAGQRITIYDSKGNIANKIEGNYCGILNMDNDCYALKYYEIHHISKDGVISTVKTSVITPTTKINDDYLYYGAKGEVYYFNNSITKVIKTDTYIAHKICATDKYVVIVKDTTLQAYSKDDYSLAYTYELTYSPLAIGANGNKLIVINNSYNSEVMNADTIFKEPNDAIQVASVEYYSLDNDYIVVGQGTTIAKFKSILGDNYEVIFNDKTSGNIGTNYKANITYNNTNKTYTLVVMGDVTGEGNINSRDTSAIFDHILDNEKLKGYYKVAGDINADNEISNIDLVKIARMIE